MTNESKLNRRDILRVGSQGIVGSMAFLSGIGTPLIEAAAQQKGATKPVRIINTAADTAFTMQELLRRQGYLEEFGLAATHLNVSDGSKVMGALLGGDSDVCMLSGFGQVLPAVEKGGKLKIIGGALLPSDDTVYSKRPDIKSVKDLVGKTVGTGAPGAVLHALMVAVLRKNGVDPANVHFVNIGSGANVFCAVLAGTVDAGPSQVEFLEMAEKNGVHTLPDGDMWTEVPDWTDQASFTADRTIAEKRDVLVKTLAAYAKLYRFIAQPNSLDAYLDAHAAALGKSDEETRRGGEVLWRFIQQHHAYAVDLVLNEERIRYMQELNMATGIQKQALPYNQVTDMSLANEAIKLIG